MSIETSLAHLRRRLEDAYCCRTPKSAALHQQAQCFLPDGDTRTGSSFKPYPTFFEHGGGSYVHDVDGHQILDFTNNATSLIHGHAHPCIVQAIHKQAAYGSAWNGPNVHQVRLAQMLCERVPSLQQLRFCNSGTEANMHVLKLARAFTGRDKFMMMDQAYHGTYDGVEVLLHDEMITPSTQGVPRNVADNVFIAQFNNEVMAERIITMHKSELSAVICNPIQTSRGLLLPTDGYLAFLRDITREFGILLIFDEVISFRVGMGGAQSLYGVTPDLTALGKIIGGGLPVGAFGGREDIMGLFSKGSVSHAGTFNGNPLTMAAGVAAMELLSAAEYERLAQKGLLLYDRLLWAMDVLAPVFELVQIASLISIAPAPGLQTNTAFLEITRLLQLALLNNGIKTSRFYTISTVMTDAEIEFMAHTLRAVLAEFGPVIEQLLEFHN